MVYLVQIFFSYLSKHGEAAGMQNDDEFSPNISLVDQALLVKMLINLELHGMLDLNFA